jgi:hypothetical protein
MVNTNPYQETVLETNISSLVAEQFPEFYRTEGPIFVEFVKAYYKWLEGSQVVSNTSFAGEGYVQVQAGNTSIVGNSTDFTDYIANGDTIAIYETEERGANYSLFTVDTVVNSSFLSITTVPKFSAKNAWYTTTYTEYNPNYYMRRYLADKDIDTTTDQFLVYFKEKYLKNIQLTTKTDIQTLLKHSLDVYRSKGTPRSVDLLFRAVFGIPASIYFPADDVFKLSSGQWVIPKYIEISLNNFSTKLIGKQIVGASSGATAFAESLVRRTVQGRLIDILYISAIEGDFQLGETINSIDNILSRDEWPVIIGSLTNADVDTGGTGANFSIGDIVDLYSDSGEQGKGLVQGITDITGIIDFDLENGGYGYQNTAQVLVSKKILTVANVQISDLNNNTGYVYIFDTVVQPLANISYSDITANVANSTMIYNYDANNLQIGSGLVLISQPNSASAGYVFVSEYSGTLNATTLYNSDNSVSITVDTYTNATCTANAIGYYTNTIHTLANRTGTFIPGEEIYQVDQYGLLVANGVDAAFSAITGNSSQITVSNTSGIFRTGSRLNGRISGASANIQQTSIFVGVMSVSNVFTSEVGNYIYFANSQSNGTVTSISQGALANVSFDPTLLYTEEVSLANDFILPKIDTSLSAATYDFSAFPSGNLTTGTLAEMFDLQTYTIGKIQQLSGINKGSDYNQAPIVKVYDSSITSRYKQDVNLNIEGSQGLFQIGEIITQDAQNSRGIIKAANATQIKVEQLRISEANNFLPTTNSTTILVGAQSNATANIVSVDIDVTSQYLGFNAKIDTSVLTAPGAVTNLDIIQSGFGYSQGDSLRFVPEGANINYPDAGFAFANLIHQGISKGYYKKKGGWLSDQAKLFDGLYYQQFSYEVRASITLDKYEEMLKQILHVAGTKYFGALVSHSKIESTCNIKKAVITVEENETIMFANNEATQYIPIF